MEDGMTKVKSGMQIHVVPYTVKRVKRTETMPVTYRKWYDGGLSSDATVVVQEGTPGKREVEVEEILSGGKVIKTNIIRSNVISRGTPGMAKTGNPEGAVGWVTTMHASAYHPSDGDGYGITATGTKAGHGTVAVDPSVIPLGWQKRRGSIRQLLILLIHFKMGQHRKYPVLFYYACENMEGPHMI